MFRNVLVGVDGRQGGRDAVALAKQLAAPGAEFSLAHVYGPGWWAGPAAGLELSALAQDSEDLLASEEEAAGIQADLISSSLCPPARGLHEIAQARGCDLLVVGSSRHALLGRALMGDDTRASLNGAPCAIAVAPRGYSAVPHPLRTLGVGYDGSPESERALAAAREVAREHDAALRALWVVSLQDVEDDKPIPADWPEAAEELVARCSRQLEQLEGVKGEAVYGGPREELIRLGDRVDLLITGSRGYGPVGALFHGSVSGHLSRHIACPLLILPRAVSGAGREAEARTAETPVTAGV